MKNNVFVFCLFAYSGCMFALDDLKELKARFKKRYANVAQELACSKEIEELCIKHELKLREHEPLSNNIAEYFREVNALKLLGKAPVPKGSQNRQEQFKKIAEHQKNLLQARNNVVVNLNQLIGD